MADNDKEDVIDLGTCTAEDMKKILPNLIPEALSEGRPLSAPFRAISKPDEEESLAARLKSACAND